VLRFALNRFVTDTGESATGRRAEKNFDLGFARLVPGVRVEYQHHFEKADDASLTYANQPTLVPGYSVTTAPAQRSRARRNRGKRR